ncbi:hypothetical protein [Desulfosporosinus sp. Sb-LF]|uniref:hypothetical protein n=1 Tax=Desulfosporosinus sp. Sb-LF TaxID=2560027 RepID=UPI00107EF8BF|nr:hypothetical protein [Desulfosporosinus sp. Sb-LF]TGE31084.1 hypothetical protein E4K68_19160 [Desulfosporosinus sp. Sb-LF]
MQPELYVEVEFFSSEEGDRTTPIFLTDYPGYRPHFRVIGYTEYLGVPFLDTPHRIINPHERVPIAVSLVYYPNVTYDKLIDGVEFEILEGPRVIGKGTVIGSSKCYPLVTKPRNFTLFLYHFQKITPI